ncbi:MAG: hypothetical protein SH850_28090 [Planctomycetaceae bacterium]|nr:hypothetical protein [Planctomycetaceae bacterium]
MTVAALLAAWSAAAPAQTPPDALADLRLMTMKTAAKEYVFRSGSGPKGEFAVSPEPLLRFTNPVSGLQAGGFFVWSDVDGRPRAAAQVFLTADNLWLHEFQSLSPNTFTATRDGKSAWEPQKPGVAVRPLPTAPPPAETAVKRLVQMREIAKRFTASDEFEGRPRSDELRLLTKPLVRFGGEQSGTLDGALFTLAHGTDPELLILLEAVRTDGEYRWHYSLAPMTGYALKATLDDQPVWEVGWRKPPYSPREPFFLLVHSREPISVEIPSKNP